MALASLRFRILIIMAATVVPAALVVLAFAYRSYDTASRAQVITLQRNADLLYGRVDTLVQAVRDALERVPPELSADIYDRGVVLTGGGALLKNLDRRIADDTQLPVQLAEDPLTSVVRGTGRILDDYSKYGNVLTT